MNQETRAIRYLYQSDLASFIGLTQRLVNPKRVYHHHWLANVLADVLSRCEEGKSNRCIVNLPPRYLKSIAASVAFPAWILARRPEANILCIAGHRSLVSAHHVQSMRLMTHPTYRSLFPHVKIIENARTIRLDQGGTRTGLSPSGGIIGRGADIIIIDDPLPASAADNIHLRAAINRWYDENIYQRLDDKWSGVIIVVMQRLHVDDLTGHLLSRQGWDVLSLPAIATEDETYPLLFGNRVLRQKGEALQPILESRDVLRAAMLRMGAKAFMAQYQQCPYAPGKGEGKHGWYSTLRVGIPWSPPADVDDLQDGFRHVSEEEIILHTVFGEGEHPWPEGAPRYLTQEEEDECMAAMRAQAARNLAMRQAAQSTISVDSSPKPAESAE